MHAMGSIYCSRHAIIYSIANNLINLPVPHLNWNIRFDYAHYSWSCDNRDGYFASRFLASILMAF